MLYDDATFVDANTTGISHTGAGILREGTACHTLTHVEFNILHYYYIRHLNMSVTRLCPSLQGPSTPNFNNNILTYNYYRYRASY